MKTIKQVLGEFARLQRKYVDINGFVDLKTFKDKSGESKYWSVTLTVTVFKGEEIEWREKLDWTHFSGQTEMETSEEIEAWLEDAGGYKLSQISWMAGVNRVNM